MYGEKNAENNEVIMKNRQLHPNGLSQTIQYLLISSAFIPSLCLQSHPKRRKRKCADDDDNFVLCPVQHIHIILFVHGII